MPRAPLVLAILLAMLAAAVVVSGQSREERDLQRLQSQIEDLERRMRGLRDREQSAALELEKVELELDLRNRELRRAERAVASLIEDQALMERRLGELRAEQEAQERFLAGRMRALYKMGGLSYLRLLFSARVDRNMLDSIGMLNYLVQRDSRTIARFKAMKTVVDEESRALARRRVAVERAHVEVSSRQRAVEEKRLEQRTLLSRVRAESRQSEARLTELTEKASRLQHLMDLLYERDRAGGVGTSISGVKGALSWPVEGRILSSFGRQRSERYATFTINNGLTIESPPGTPVRAMFDGTVLYAQWFKGYGNLVILDHGDRVFSLYGNLRSSGVAQGGVVRAGETIGIVGESEEQDGGALYFEIRENNQPVDPRSWLR